MESSEPSSNQSASFWAPRRLNLDAARQEQRIYWSRKSVAERLAAATKLTGQLYRMRGIDIDERKADLTPVRVRRRNLADVEELELIPEPPED